MKYLSTVETAALIRRALKDSFPGVKFSVRSDIYSGGSTIRVRYAGYRGYKPLDACYCPSGPTVGSDPGRCAKCGYIGRLTPDYLPGMPTEEAVREVVGGFSGKGFDGMVDMAYYIDAYVKDGRVVGTKSNGSYGSVPAWDDAVEGAELVHFGAGFVSVAGYA